MSITEQLDRTQLHRAAEILGRGGVVAFPTETVFGLGADATNSSAIQSLFEAKGRPSDNPLIVHLADFSQLDGVCRDIPPIAARLYERWSPGPLTLVMRKQSVISSLATAGLDTVAVRFPSHPIARELCRLAGVPIAAPSANVSGRPSSTTWKAVMEDLQGRIDAIVCEDGCEIGLESTVVDLTSHLPTLLRPGSIGFEELQSEIPDLQWRNASTTANANSSAVANSPGLRHRHYQPRAKVKLGHPDELHESMYRVAYIGIGDWVGPTLSLDCRCSSIEEYAAKVYEFFREADRRSIDTIYCEKVESRGVGAALMDRLRRAAEDRTDSSGTH